jgi:uncharacterized membrane protein YccC
VIDNAWRWVRAHDPNYAAAKRALRAAVVVPVNFAVGSQLIGDAQVATFAAFGSFALLIFASFPGGRTDRIAAYLALGGAGAALICLGTLVATPDWLAVAGMGVIAFGIVFAGVISSVINAGTQAALLAFILAVMLPGAHSAIPARLAGWGIAFAVSVPVAILVWPPAGQNPLRLRVAALCRALAGMLDLDQRREGQRDPLVVMSAATRELRAAFRVSAAAPTAALSTSGRLLIRLINELDWLTTIVTNACADAPDGWPAQGRRLRTAAQHTLVACAASVEPDGRGDAGALAGAIDALQDDRDAVAAEALAQLRTSSGGDGTGPRAGEFDRPLYAAHELGYAVTLAALTVSDIAAADARSWWARLLGRRLPGDDLGSAAAAQQAASGHLNRGSVWLQNSVRAAVGLALAVLLARLVGAQNAFWVGLGALSVLRSNALSTGATVLRALAGTVLGFAIGGGLVAVIGTNRAVLWTLLPLVAFVAASAPAVISFIAGQAAFTVFTIILFNIIAPIGWQVGVLRIEDVALGCAAALVAGVLFWPRGAAAALGSAYAEAYRTAAAFLHEAIGSLDPRSAVAAPTASAAGIATAAGSRLDDALRQYLAEHGAKRVPLDSVTALAGGATRLRLAGAAINRLHSAAPDGVVAPQGDAALEAPVTLLHRRADEVTEWYSALADAVDGRGAAVPPTDSPMNDESFLDVVLPAVHNCGDADRAVRAEQLLWSGQYLGDIDRLRPELIKPAEQVGAARASRWWHR